MRVCRRNSNAIKRNAAGFAAGEATHWKSFAGLSNADPIERRSYLALQRALATIACCSCEGPPETRDARAGGSACECTNDGREVAWGLTPGDSPLPSLGDELRRCEIGVGRKVSEAERKPSDREAVNWRCTRMMHEVAGWARTGRTRRAVWVHEIDADALGEDQHHHVLDLVEQGWARR